MVKQILIMRHGESIGNKNNVIQGKYDKYGLSENGIFQAIETSKIIIDYRPDLIMSSPLKRAIDTSEIIRGELDISNPIIVEPLLEEIYFGKLEGKTKEYRSLYYSKEYAMVLLNNYDFSFIEGEPIANVRLRAEQLKSKLVNMDVSTLLLVTHGGFMREFIYTYGFPYQEYVYQNSCLFLINDEEIKKLN